MTNFNKFTETVAHRKRWPLKRCLFSLWTKKLVQKYWNFDSSTEPRIVQQRSKCSKRQAYCPDSIQSTSSTCFGKLSHSPFRKWSYLRRSSLRISRKQRQKQLSTRKESSKPKQAITTSMPWKLARKYCTTCMRASQCGCLAMIASLWVPFMAPIKIKMATSLSYFRTSRSSKCQSTSFKVCAPLANTFPSTDPTWAHNKSGVLARRLVAAIPWDLHWIAENTSFSMFKFLILLWISFNIEITRVGFSPQKFACRSNWIQWVTLKFRI